MAAYLIVRAVVPETDRAKFDQWYQDIHLPGALAVFDAVKAWRGWSHDDPAVHFASTSFPAWRRRWLLVIPRAWKTCALISTGTGRIGFRGAGNSLKLPRT